MSITLLPESPASTEQYVDELLELPTLLPSGSVHYEIHRGRLIVMCLPAKKQSRCQSRIDYYLTGEGDLKGLGEAYSEVGIALKADVESLRGPDAAFNSSSSLPVRTDHRGYLIAAPELCVEILSPSNTKLQIELKTELNLEEGAKIVWVLDPKTKTVAEHRPAKEIRIWQSNEILEIPDIIPDFKVAVEQLFPE